MSLASRHVVDKPLRYLDVSETIHLAREPLVRPLRLGNLLVRRGKEGLPLGKREARQRLDIALAKLGVPNNECLVPFLLSSGQKRRRRGSVLPLVWCC